MRRKHLPVILSFILLVITACSLTIAEVPYWMTGDWEIYSETGEYIGSCEIDTYSIEITIDRLNHDSFDILDDALQNGGTAESSETTFCIYYDITRNNYYKFIRDSDIRITVICSMDFNLDEYFLMRK